MDNRIMKQLAFDELAITYWRRKLKAGLIGYSERGNQSACQTGKYIMISRRSRSIWNDYEHEHQR